MKRSDQELDKILDQALDEIRDTSPEPASERAVTDRVWQRLQDAELRHAGAPGAAQPIQSCADFQRLIPDMLSGRLDEARRLLVRDHVGECVSCRRKLNELRAPAATDRTARTAPGRLARFGWRAAAAAAVFIAVIGLSFNSEVFSFETGGVIKIRHIEGQLLHLTEDGTELLSPGDQLTLGKGDAIRATRGSTATVELADMSQVEMRERAELAVLERRSLLPGRRSDGRIDLQRGSIIVEASDQGSGHLYVDTKDCRVAVKGTIFAVNHGAKGSRVSVIEGQVQVDYSGNQDLLQAGQQTTTNPSLVQVPVEDEIAWSGNRERHMLLLQEMRAVGREMDRVFRPEARYATTLLDMAPAGTVVYIAMPNVSGDLDEAYRVLLERAGSSEVLRQWWQEMVVDSGAEDRLDQFVGAVREYGDHLGSEVVMTLQLDSRGEPGTPLFLAQLDRPEAFASFMESKQAELGPDHPRVRLIEGPTPTHPAEKTDVYFWKRDDLLVVGFDFDDLLQFSNGSRMAGSPFHGRLADLYDEGVEWLIGVDLQGMIAANTNRGSDTTALERMGLLDVQHLIVERKERANRTEKRAALTFGQTRRGIAAWLASPAPMGAMDFISPEANLAAAFVTKDSERMVDELFEIIRAAEPDFDAHLADFEREHGIDVRRDIAAPLGGEVALALDGPLLPTPSWKLVLEVYDPARLEQTLEWIVEHVDQAIAESGGQGLSLERQEIGGRAFLRLASLDTGLAAHLTFEDGYAVVAPSRALLERALQNRALGINLYDSASFGALLPQDGQVNFSGVLYENMGDVLEPLARKLSEMHDGPEDRMLTNVMSSGSRPSLALVYGEATRIVMVSTSEGGLFSSSFDRLANFGGLMGVQSLMRNAGIEARRQTANDGVPQP